LASGLNFLKAGQWVESKEQIEVLPQGGAAAVQDQHQAYFPGDIYQGQIELVTPDGQHLQSRPAGLSYDDGTKTVLIAELKSSVGQLAGQNQVIYPDAFNGLKADLRYTYTKAGFEQDIILRAQPPTPESLGLNPATARLQVLTEFFSPPQPAIQARKLAAQAGLSLPDQSLGFGAMQMVPGRAFLLGNNAVDSGAQVGKQWLLLDGRQFLVEEVPVDAIADGLAALPLTAMQPGSGKASHTASRHLALPPQRLVRTVPNRYPMPMTKAALPAQGLVLDYVTLNVNTNNFTFQGDTTYYISGSLNLSATNIFEGGAVLKYTNGASLNFVSIGAGAVQMLSTAYRPVIFTARDDNSVGGIISGSTGTPTNYYASPALSFSSSPRQMLANFRIACAHQAISAVNAPVTVYNAQIVNCQNGVGLNDVTLYFRNVLFANVLTNFTVSYNGNIDVQNATFNGSAYLAVTNNPYYSLTLSLENCILANVTNLVVSGSLSGTNNGFYNSPPFGTAANSSSMYPFQTVGAGNCYLTNGCGFYNAGTTNIDATLLASLQKKTTYPPIVYSNITISVNTSLSPQVQRDTDTPDLGYHYDPLDYLITGTPTTGLNIGAGVTLTLTNGVAVGMACQNGFSLNTSSSFISQGRADAMNHLVWYQAVQEQPKQLSGGALTESGIFYIHIFTYYPAMQFSFTDIPALGCRCPLFYYNVSPGYFSLFSFTNCWLRGMNLTVVPGYVSPANCSTLSTVVLQNNLLERSTVSLYNGCAGYSSGGPITYYDNPLALTARNNLFWHSTVSLAYSNSWPATGCFPAWSITDNLFDTSTNKLAMDTYSTGHISLWNNAFFGITNSLGGTTNLVVTSLSYAIGPLGSWYIGSSSPALVDMGSRSAGSAGLYHYTMFTNLVNACELAETNTIVDIGFHYVVTDGYGNPLETLWFGIPDYLADTNGELAAWEMEYFGHLGLDPNASYDGQGHTLLYDYLHGINPVCINILSQPLSQEVLGGDTVTFTVVAGGQGLTYQWTFNGVPILGATSSSYTINNVQNDGGDYAVIITSAVGGSVTSQAATLTEDPGTGYPAAMMTLGPRQDYIFRNGVTYYIGSPVQLFGTTTMEGGAVIEFDYNQLYPTLQVLGTLVCHGGLYDPTVLTTVDDDAIGMSWGNNSPQTVVTGVPSRIWI